MKKKRGKYTRREFIKTSGKIGLTSALYGTVGNFLGRGYKKGRDVYREEIKPYVEKGKEIIDKTEEIKENTINFISKYNPFRKKETFSEDTLPKKNDKKIDRRNFFKILLDYGHEHPVGSGTVVLGTYGGIKKSLQILPEYITKKDIAILKDKEISNTEKIKILDDYGHKLEKEIIGIKKGYLDQKNYLAKIEKEFGEVKKLLKKEAPNDLEAIVKKDNPLLVGVGFVGIIIAITLGSLNLTGFFVLNKNLSQTYLTGAIIFLISLVLIYLGKNKQYKKFF